MSGVAHEPTRTSSRRVTHDVRVMHRLADLHQLIRSRPAVSSVAARSGEPHAVTHCCASSTPSRITAREDGHLEETDARAGRLRRPSMREWRQPHSRAPRNGKSPGEIYGDTVGAASSRRSCNAAGAGRGESEQGRAPDRIRTRKPALSRLQCSIPDNRLASGPRSQMEGPGVSGGGHGPVTPPVSAGTGWVSSLLRWLGFGAPAAANGAAGLAERAATAAARYPKQVEQAQLQSSIKSFTANIVKHQGYLKNPEAHVSNWSQLSRQHQQNLIHHWNQGIVRAEAYRDIAEGILGGVLK